MCVHRCIGEMNVKVAMDFDRRDEDGLVALVHGMRRAVVFFRDTGAADSVGVLVEAFSDLKEIVGAQVIRVSMMDHGDHAFVFSIV